MAKTDETEPEVVRETVHVATATEEYIADAETGEILELIEKAAFPPDDFAPTVR